MLRPDSESSGKTIIIGIGGLSLDHLASQPSTHARKNAHMMLSKLTQINKNSPLVCILKICSPRILVMASYVFFLAESDFEGRGPQQTPPK